MKRRLACIVLVGGCAIEPMETKALDPSGNYTVHRSISLYDACPPYVDPDAFALSITSQCAASPIAPDTSCEPLAKNGAMLEFDLHEKWSAGAGVPSDYPPYVTATVHFVLHPDANVLSGSADGSYVYDTPTTGDDCRYTWNVTATPN